MHPPRSGVTPNDLQSRTACLWLVEWPERVWPATPPYPSACKALIIRAWRHGNGSHASLWYAWALWPRSACWPWPSWGMWARRGWRRASAGRLRELWGRSPPSSRFSGLQPLHKPPSPCGQGVGRSSRRGTLRVRVRGCRGLGQRRQKSVTPSPWQRVMGPCSQAEAFVTLLRERRTSAHDHRSRPEDRAAPLDATCFSAATAVSAVRSVHSGRWRHDGRAGHPELGRTGHQQCPSDEDRRWLGDRAGSPAAGRSRRRSLRSH
ncbi:hypothetical protein SUDANB15_07357 [Streptomyces sp. enrichment culture]